MAKTTESRIRQLVDSASVLQGDIANNTKHPWPFEGELNMDDAVNHVLKVLSAFSRWLMEGLAKSLTTEMVRSATTHRVLTINQNIMYCYKLNRQVTYRSKHQDAPF